MKTMIILIIASSLIAQNQPYNPLLGIQVPNNIIITQPVQNEANAEMYLQFQIQQQAINTRINQALANQALVEANPNYKPRDFIREQQWIDALVNPKK